MKLDDVTVGRRYGKAIFELAVENDQLEGIYQELLSIQEVFIKIPDLGKMLSDVRLDPKEKEKILSELIKDYSRLVRNFLQVVYDYNRMYDILFMIENFEARYNKEKGIVKGIVTTAIKLTNGQKEKIETAFAKKIGCTQAYLENRVDDSIIGGIIVEGNNQKIDGSIQTQLEKMKQLLLK